MTKDEYNEIVQGLGWSINQSGRELGVSTRQAHRYANGHAPIPEPVARLLRLRSDSGANHSH